MALRASIRRAPTFAGRCVREEIMSETGNKRIGKLENGRRNERWSVSKKKNGHRSEPLNPEGSR